MIAGDDNQAGDIRSGDHAGGNITHNDLDRIARLLQYFTDSLEAQREADRRERLDRQREIDTYTIGVRGAIEALRGEQAKVRDQVGSMKLIVDHIDRRTRYTPHVTVLMFVLIAVVIAVIAAIIWWIWPTVYPLAASAYGVVSGK